MSAYVHKEVSGSVARITLDRPETKNAFHDEVIGELIRTWEELSDRKDTRVMVLESRGDVFSAGADLHWMKRMADYDFSENVADAEKLWACVEKLHLLPFPTLCRVQGPAFGGALGLMAACDIVLAAETAAFAFSEVRLGLAPAVISPFVARKVPPAQLADTFLSGRRFTAKEAEMWGLVTRAVPEADLDETVEKFIRRILSGSPSAQRSIKDLLNRIPFSSSAKARSFTTSLISELRASEEGKEGINAFFDRRKPSWAK